MKEEWEPLEHLIRHCVRVEGAPVLHVDQNRYKVNCVLLTFSWTERQGVEELVSVVRVYGQQINSSGGGAHSSSRYDKVGTREFSIPLEKLKDNVPAWLDNIITRATPIR